jgi:hypothetical protein
MSRKKKAPPDKPSKAYLVSFGDTMTALLAFFIVLNSFAKDQTGANMYSGTGSFINSMSSIGLPGDFPGDRTSQVVQQKAPSPIYAVESPDEKKDSQEQLGPDDNPDKKRIIDRQTDEFKRFLTEVNRKFDVQEEPATENQIVFDSFEKLRREKSGGSNVDELDPQYDPLQDKAIKIASDAISKLTRNEYELEIVVWAPMPSPKAMARTITTAVAVQNQIDRLFRFTPQQRARVSSSAKPWLFFDAARPKVSFILSKIDRSN